MRFVGRGAHRVAPGEVAVRPGGVLSDPISESADEVRQAAPATAVVADGLLAGNRTALLRTAGGQDTDRDAYQGHAAERQQLQLALPCDKHPDKYVTLCLAAASFRIILHHGRRRRGARRRLAGPIRIDMNEELGREEDSAPRIPTLDMSNRTNATRSDEVAAFSTTMSA